jgi:hypothetical protein
LGGPERFWPPWHMIKPEVELPPPLDHPVLPVEFVFEPEYPKLGEPFKLKAKLSPKRDLAYVYLNWGIDSQNPNLRYFCKIGFTGKHISKLFGGDESAGWIGSLKAGEHIIELAEVTITCPGEHYFDIYVTYVPDDKNKIIYVGGYHLLILDIRKDKTEFLRKSRLPKKEDYIRLVEKKVEEKAIEDVDGVDYDRMKDLIEKGYPLEEMTKEELIKEKVILPGELKRLRELEREREKEEREHRIKRWEMEYKKRLEERKEEIERKNKIGKEAFSRLMKKGLLRHRDAVDAENLHRLLSKGIEPSELTREELIKEGVIEPEALEVIKKE